MNARSLRRNCRDCQPLSSWSREYLPKSLDSGHPNSPSHVPAFTFPFRYLAASPTLPSSWTWDSGPTLKKRFTPSRIRDRGVSSVWELNSVYGYVFGYAPCHYLATPLKKGQLRMSGQAGVRAHTSHLTAHLTEHSLAAHGYDINSLQFALLGKH